MAEIEFSALSRACLRGRNPDADALQRAITAYETRRNPCCAARASLSTGASEPTTPGSNFIAATPAFPMLTEY